MSVQETRRRSLDFDLLVDKLEQIQEITDGNDDWVLLTPVKDNAEKQSIIDLETEGIIKELENLQTDEIEEQTKTQKEFHLEYQETEIVLPTPKEKLPNKDVSKKLCLDNLPKSSIIEHYNTKKTYITSSETSHLTQESHKITSKKIEVNIRTSNIFTEQEKVKSKINTQKKVESAQTSTMKIISQVRVLTLNDNEHQDSTLYRIEKNWTLQFRLGPSLLGRKVSLYCNYPETKDGKILEFNRDRYFLLSWVQDEGCQHSDDTALYTQITVKIAGSFHYYFIYENA